MKRKKSENQTKSRPLNSSHAILATEKDPFTWSQKSGFQMKLGRADGREKKARAAAFPR